MKTPWAYSLAIRKPDGSIKDFRKDFRSIVYRFQINRIPILRGIVTMVEVLWIGIWALSFSADVAMPEDEKKPGEETTMNPLFMGVTLCLSFGFALLLFFFLPLLITSRLLHLDQNIIAFNLVAGTLRVSLFLIYLWVITFMKDIQRVFEYHGAEHKSIANYESGEPLTPENAEKFTRFHPRCGTSFLFMVLVVAILFFSICDAAIVSVTGSLLLWQRIMYHFLIIPLIAGAGYEVIRVSAANPKNGFFRRLMIPGLMLQKLTTREPDREQLEIAIRAMKSALEATPAGMNQVDAEVIL